MDDGGDDMQEWRRGWEGWIAYGAALIVMPQEVKAGQVASVALSTAARCKSRRPTSLRLELGESADTKPPEPELFLEPGIDKLRYS
ncbi:MAG: hypothetical protein WBX22_19385 [Silvibacterium sp.]